MKFFERLRKPASRRADPSTERVQVLRRSAPWHAVSIVAKTVPCEAAQALRGKRFLSAAAPRLPLPGCTRCNSCACGYKHHADRRAPRRRDDGAGFGRRGQAEQNRRVSPGRRETD